MTEEQRELDELLKLAAAQGDWPRVLELLDQQEARLERNERDRVIDWPEVEGEPVDVPAPEVAPVRSWPRAKAFFDEELKARVMGTPGLTFLELWAFAVVDLFPTAYKLGAGPDAIDLADQPELDDRAWTLLLATSRQTLRGSNYTAMREHMPDEWHQAMRLTVPQLKKLYRSAKRKVKKHVRNR